MQVTRPQARWAGWGGGGSESVLTVWDVPEASAACAERLLWWLGRELEDKTEHRTRPRVAPQEWSPRV